ncbi:MAG: thermonuclease family protein [Candidatus Omnitrophota bacterium]|nr:thermonuclease family protein [Candidatus Omnitrophota bacterium]
MKYLPIYGVLPIFFLLAIPTAQAEKVQYVIDGDTLMLMNNEKVRLIGIDAPEIENTKYQREGEYYGEEAKRYLSDLVLGKDVRLDPPGEHYDKYGRRLAYVYLEDLLVNAELIRLGYADVYRKFPFEKNVEFIRLEEEARKRQRGLWNPRGKEEWESGRKFNVLGPILIIGTLGGLAILFLRKV